MQQTTGVEGKGRQEEFASHGEDGMEEIDREGVPAQIARPAIQPRGQHTRHGTHATQETGRVGQRGDFAPAAMVGPQGKHEKRNPGPCRGAEKPKQVAMEQAYGHSQYIIESIAGRQQGREEAHCGGQANQQEEGGERACTLLQAECEPVEQGTHHHAVQEPVGPYAGHAERAQQGGRGELGEPVTHGHHGGQAGKARDQDAVGQQDAQFVEGKLPGRLAHAGQVTCDEQEGGHEEHEDDLPHAGVQGAEVHDVHQDDHEDERGPEEVDAVVCLLVHHALSPD